MGTTANTGDADNLADPDRDGVVNLLEYGLATNPIVGQDTLPSPSIGKWETGSYLRAFFTRDLTRDDVTIRVEVASDLAGPWFTVASSIKGASMSKLGLVTETDLAGGLKQVEVRDFVPSTAAARRFLRIVVAEE